MWIILDWIISIVLLIAIAIWLAWFAMRIVKAYALADGGFWARLRAAVVAVLAASWATIVAPLRGLWAAALRSLTVLWAYLGIAVSYALANLDDLGAVLGDPDLKQQVIDGLKDNPHWLGWALGVIFVVTLAARLRSILARPREDR